MTEAFSKAMLRPMTTTSGRPIRRPPASADSPPAIPVHFNPDSLSITIRNQMEEGRKQSGRPPQQLVSSSEISLAVQLLFDTTLTGRDVRETTAAIGEMMRPGTVVPREQGKQRPQVVQFEWSNFVFNGVITDYSETLEYFSADGVPLRSSLNLTLLQHEDAFPAAGGGSTSVAGGLPTAPAATGESVEDATRRAGGGDNAQAVAQANNVENIRNSEFDELASPSAATETAERSGAFGSPLGFATNTGNSGSPSPLAFSLDSSDVVSDITSGPGQSDTPLAPGNTPSATDTSAFAGLRSLTPGAGANSGFGSGSTPGSVARLGVTDFELPAAVPFSASVNLESGVSLGGAAEAVASPVAGFGGHEIAVVGREFDLSDIFFKEDE